MVNFSELKAKAEKAKDAGMARVANTRDRFSSASTSRNNWDPNWKRAPPPPPATASSRASISGGGPPPPPLRARPEIVVSDESTTPPVVSRGLRQTDGPPPYVARPPPTRAASGYPPSHREGSEEAVDRIDWANLSAEDKEALFGWLDEFFSRYLGVELGPRVRKAGVPLSVAAVLPVQNTQRMRSTPTINKATRPSLMQ